MTRHIITLLIDHWVFDSVVLTLVLHNKAVIIKSNLFYIIMYVTTQIPKINNVNLTILNVMNY